MERRKSKKVSSHLPDASFPLAATYLLLPASWLLSPDPCLWGCPKCLHHLELRQPRLRGASFRTPGQQSLSEGRSHVRFSSKTLGILWNAAGGIGDGNARRLWLQI